MSSIVLLIGLSASFLASQLAEAAATFRSRSTAASSGGANVSLTLGAPAGVAAGDVLIASVAVTPGTVTIAAPSGWTPVQTLQNTNNTTSRLAIFRRVAGGAEPASYVWTTAGVNAGLVGAVASFAGVDNANPVNVENGRITSSSRTQTTPGIGTTKANTLLVATFSYASSGTWTPPAGMTEIVDIKSQTTSGSAGESLGMTYQTQAAAGSVGGKSARASTSADRGATHILALNPASTVASLDHVQIEHDGAGSTCQAETVTVKACANAACSSLYTGGNTTATLTPGAGGAISWSGNPIAFNGSATVNLSVTGAQTVTLGTSSVSPAPLAATVCYINATPSCALSFASSTFGFSAIPTQRAGVASSSITLQAASGGGCTGLSNAQTVQMAFQCEDPSTCAGRQVTVNSTAIAANSAAGVGSWTNVALNFGGNSTASFTLSYPDVGKINLAARYTLSGGNYIQGYSNAFVVLPYGFAFGGIKRTADNFANPAAGSAAGAAFMKAGEDFSATVAAVTGSGAATPNFGRETAAQGVALTHTLIAPAAGDEGNLGGTTTIDGSSFSGGVASANDLNWDEAGIIALTASIGGDGNYLGGGVVSSVSGNIGRFIPAYFTTEVTPACSAGAKAFTYSGQHADVAVTAYNAFDQTVSNYDSAYGFAKTVTLSDAGNAAGFTLNTLSGGIVAGEGVDRDAVYTFSGKQTAPKTIVLRAADTDGVSSAGHEMTDPSILPNSNSLIYSGRLRMANAYGSELLKLPALLAAEYFDGVDWARNADDYCTTLALSPTVNSAPSGYRYGDLTVSNPTGALSVAASAPSLASPLAAGDAGLIWSVPGAGNAGSFDLTVNLSGTAIKPQTWLQYDWDGDGAADDNPTARFVFGVYKNNLIDRRELY